MPDASASHPRLPILRLVILALVILVGLGLFFTLGRRTPAVVTPAESGVKP
ncbi:MAG TPA: hypothetical protein VGQ17_05975 [Gemmatimonadales bacterium]|jgi:hypothetical protein|nr:hypothetical protein [Gemmatimonadales bacterium]